MSEIGCLEMADEPLSVARFPGSLDSQCGIGIQVWPEYQ